MSKCPNKLKVVAKEKPDVSVYSSEEAINAVYVYKDEDSFLVQTEVETETENQFVFTVLSPFEFPMERVLFKMPASMPVTELRMQSSKQALLISDGLVAYINLDATEVRTLTESDFMATNSLGSPTPTQVPIISVDFNGNDQEEFTWPTTLVSLGDFKVQSDPAFSSNYSSKLTGGAVEVF